MSDDDQYEAQGDTPLEANQPSGDEEGGQPSSQPSSQPQPKQQSKLGQKAKQRIDDWKKKRADAVKKKALEKGKKAIQKLAKDQAKRVAKKAAAETAKAAAEAATSETIIGPILIWLAAKLLQLGKIAAKAFATGNYSQGASELKKSTEKSLKVPLLVAGGVIAVFFIMIVAVFGPFFVTTGGVIEQDRLMKLAAANDILLTVTKTGPETANVGDEITYTINVNSQSPDYDATVSDPLPNGLEFVKASQAVSCSNTTDNSCNAASKIINWSSKTNNLTPPLNTSFTITAKVTSAASNTYAVNLATGIIATRSATTQ